MAEVVSVLVHVSEKLASFLGEEGRLLGGLREEMQLISHEFGHMKAFLQKVSEFNAANYDPQMREWIRQVRQSAYDAEDILGEFILLFPNGSPPPSWNLKKLIARHRLATKLQTIKARISNISDARLRYESQFANAQQEKVPGIPASNAAWRQSKDDDALLADEARLVAIEKPKEHLISQVLEGDSQVKVIAVLGMGGLGKTTLVKKVHDDAAVKNKFQIRAWMTVSQTCDFQKLLKGLIRQIQAAFNQPAPPAMGSMDIYELKALVKDLLQTARYAIVFDDVWDTQFWDAFKFVLPENSFGGNRVILTTRIAQVALASCADSQGHVYKMEHLAFDESRTLFYRGTFKDGICPVHLENVVESIVRKCGGLPLAIVAMSGLLATKDPSMMDEWERAKSRLGDEYDQGTGKLETAKNTLRLSYDDLPSTLKTCLLYISIYPEDCKIRCYHLIRLWIAENFVQGRAGMSAEDVAWNYFKQLADRSLIHVSGVTYPGSLLTVHIHDLVRDVIVSESRDQNMMTIVSSTTVWPSDSAVRRLVFHINPLDSTTLRSHHHFSNLHSVISTGCKEPLSEELLIELLSNKLLKVLDLEGLSMQVIPKGIFYLFHLKYLSLTKTRIKLVPKSIKRLQNLECLDLKEADVRELPKEILKLQKLRHLFVLRRVDSTDIDSGCFGFKAPCNMGQLLELQTLERVDASENDQNRILNEIGKLVQLRKLGVTNMRTKDGKEFCYSLEKLTNLRELYLTSSTERDGMILDLNHHLSASSLQCVCSVSLRGRLERMPPWIGNLQKLGYVKLTWSGLSDDPLESLQHLPNLTEVALIQAYEGETLCFKARGFPKLKYLSLKNMKGMVQITVEEGAMPQVERVVLQQLPLLVELPSGLQHLRKLQELELWSMSSELTFMLESEVFEGCEEISHIPRVLIGSVRDGKWSSRLLFQNKKAQARRNLDADIVVASENSSENLVLFADYFSLPSCLAFALLSLLFAFLLSLYSG